MCGFPSVLSNALSQNVPLLYEYTHIFRISPLLISVDACSRIVQMSMIMKWRVSVYSKCRNYPMIFFPVTLFPLRKYMSILNTWWYAYSCGLQVMLQQNCEFCWDEVWTTWMKWSKVSMLVTYIYKYPFKINLMTFHRCGRTQSFKTEVEGRRCRTYKWA